MLTCGTYDAAGDFAYRVGLPGKSGVGGGIVAVVPGRCTLCVWSPGLDARGDSVAGVAALDHFTTLTGWSVFGGARRSRRLRRGGESLDMRLSRDPPDAPRRGRMAPARTRGRVGARTARRWGWRAAWRGGSMEG